MPNSFSHTEDLAENVLFNPIRDGANRLCILSAYATPSMASWLLKSYEEQDISNVSVELIVGSVIDEGIDEASHNGFKEIHENKSVGEWGHFTCSYIRQPPANRQNYYIWLDGEKPMHAFMGTYSFTQASMLRHNSGTMRHYAAGAAYSRYEKAVDRSIYCNHAEVEDYIVVKPSVIDTVPQIPDRIKEYCVRLSLLARGGETGTKSGLNWGQRNNRNKNEAYIPLPITVARSGFFPLNKEHFLVVTDDHHTLQLRVEQENDKAITTPASNALLGEYFRNRLGLANGEYVTKEHLLKYGRTDVTFYKIDEEQYYMDFSIETSR